MATPRGFQGELYPHQIKSLHRLVQLDDTCKVAIDDNTWVHSTASILCDPLGSGKTAVVISLILLRPIPVGFPQFSGVYGERLSSTLCAYPRKLLRPTLIAVGGASMQGWIDQFAKFAPQLRVFTVATGRSVRRLEKMIGTGIIHYDIILVRNAEFMSDGEKIHTVDAIYSISCGYSWARVVYDDFDDGGISYSTPIISSVRTLFISSVRGKKCAYVSPLINGIDAFGSVRPRVIDALSDNTLFTHFGVGGTVEESVTVPSMIGYRCIYDNRYDKYISMIEVISDEVAALINGGAIDEAAELVGVGRPRIVSILGGLLDELRSSISNITVKRATLMLAGDMEGVHDVTAELSQKMSIFGLFCAARGQQLCDFCGCIGQFSAVCCGGIMCAGCAFGGFARYTRGIYGVCRMCNNGIEMRDMIFIGSDPLPTVQISAESAGLPPVCGITSEIVQGKLVAIKDIICGIAPAGAIPSRIHLRSVISGSAILPSSERRVLIYCGKSTRIVADFLQKCLIPTLILRGTGAERARIMDDFRAGPIAVLLVGVDYAGIHAEFVTDLILYHAIIDAGIMARICGRVQRVGRTCSVRIWQLCYKNELNN